MKKKRKKLGRKLLSFVLTLVMVFSTMTGIVPFMDTSMTVKAEVAEKTIAGLGTSAIGNPTSTGSTATAWTGSYVYYGKYNGTSPTKYRVLDKVSNDFGVAGGSLLLDCDTTLYKAVFHGSKNMNVWSSSALRSGLQGDDFLNKSDVFTEQEKGAIASSTKAAAAQNDGSGHSALNYAALSGDTVFVLDAKEASRESYGYASNGTRNKSGTESYGWWLRSPHKSYVNNAGLVYGETDEIDYRPVMDDEVGVSPAFNINLSSVIFASAISGESGSYKLTLKDDKISVDLTSDKKVTKSGNTLTIPYTVSGDNAGNANQVSVLVTDKAYDAEGAAIKKYGKLADVTGSTLSGEAGFDLPSGLTGTLGTDYHVYLLAEDVNGEKETDYANLKEITVGDISSKSAQTVTAPTKATGLTYKKDQAQALLTSGASVTTGNTATGSIQYRVGTDGTWSTEIPKGTDAGNYDVYYKVEGNDTYTEYAPTTPITVTIAKANPETPTGLTGKYGQKLSTVSLSGGWSWADGETIMSAGVGDYKYKANYNPTDADATNYNSLSDVDLTVKVGKGDGTISFAKTEVESTIGVEPPSVYFENTGNGVVTFTSDNEDVATVDEDGDLTIIGAGETTITASVVDSATYQYATKSVSYKLIVNKRSASIKTVPTASEITYGQTLADSKLSGGEVLPNIEGTFSWVDSGVAPAVSDSETTEYAVKFTPKNSDIYAESTCKVKVKVNKKTVPATELEDAQKPVAKTGDDLAYTGEPIDLVTAPTADLPLDYEAYYSTDNGETWSTDIPKKTDPGTYTVKVKYVSKGGNCNDIILDDITATITPADKTALTDAITAAKTYYDTIKDNPDYSDAADKLDKAIKAAEEVAAKAKVTKSDVSTATNAVNTAKTTAETEVKDIDNTKAAQAVSDKIAALPAKDAVTKEDKTAIEEARAAYNALTEAQKAKVTPDTFKKLTDDEDKLAVLQAMSEVSAKTGSDVVYTGNPIRLINTPTTKLPEGYKMVYAVTTENKAPTDEKLYTTDIPTETDAGTYYVWYMVKGDGDHSDTTPECIEVIIEKADMAVGVEGYDGIYDGAAHGITVNVTKPATGYTISYGTQEGTYDLTTAPTYTHASDETNTVYFKVSANGYNDHTGSASVKISKRPVTVTADDKSTTYGAETESLTYTVSGNIIDGDDLSIQLDTEASASKPVGEYPITVSYDTTKTDYAVTTVQGKYTINGADITVTASGYSGTYDGAAHGITVETSGDDTVTVYYSTETELNDENYQTAGSTDNPTRTDAGTTTVYYYVSSQNYVPTSVYGNKDIVITKAEVGTQEVSMNGYTYGGDVPAPSIGDFPGGGAVTYFYNTVNSTEGGTEWKDMTATTLNTGEYFMYAVIAESDNYNAYTTATTSFTVDKADQSPDSIIPPVEKTGIVYNGAEQELVEAGSAAEGTMLYAVITDGTTPEAEAYKEDIPKAIEPGTYYVWYMVKGDGNHNDTKPTVVEVIIDPIDVKSIGLRAVTGTAMEPGTSQQLEMTTEPSGVPARHLMWTSSAPDTVSVNSTGLVTAGSVPGDAVITAKAHNGVQASITIKVVEEKIEVESVEIDKTSVKKDPKPGDSFRLTAVIKPANATDKTVTWESSDTEVAEIGVNGIVTVRKPGETKVTVKAANGTLSDNIILNVKEVPVTGIAIDTIGGDDYLVAGKMARLTATVTPADATEKGVIWSSSDPDTASVNEYGVVTAHKEGRVTITAASKDNNEISATADFIVFGGDDSLYVEFAFGSDYAYTGSAITPMVNVYYRGELLTRDTDYTVSYKNNKNANDASNVKKAPTVKVTGKTVAATAEAVFKILPADIGDEDLVTVQEVTVASGKKAAPELYFGGTKLAGKDFTNPYAKDKFYNSRPITVYGKGNFTGEREIWINVKTEQEVKNQPKIKVKSFTPVKRYYNGQPQLIDESEIIVVNSADKSNTPLTIDQDFYIAYPEDVTSVGTVKIAVVGMGDYTGVVKKSYKIEAAKDDDVAEEGLDVSFLYSEGEYEVDGVKYDTFTYRPGGVQPYVNVDVTLKSGEIETLISGRDYKVTYKDNKKAAAANKGKLSTATITFKGNYKSLKKVEKKFYIKQADLGAASVYAGNKVVTKGNVKYPLQAPIVDIDGVTVKKNEYTVTYTDADDKPLDNKSKLNLQNSGDSAEIKVKITPKKANGNYTGTNESGSYVITLADASKDLSKAKVIIQKTGDPNHKAVRKFDFTGKPIVIGEEPNEGYELYVYIGKNANDPNKVVLTEDTDYTVEYSNNVKAGKATIILNAVDGSENCFGSRTHTFNIVKGIMRWVKR